MPVPPLEHLVGLALVGFIVFFIIGYRRNQAGRPEVIEIVRDAYSKFFGRPFTRKDLELAVEPELKDFIDEAIEFMERNDLVIKKGSRYEFKEGFLFMSEEKYEEAKRVLVGDRILYGSYQHLILTRPWLLLIPGSIIILAVVFVYLVYTNSFGLYDKFNSALGDVVSLDLFFIFIIAYAFVVAEALLRFIRTFGEQIYTVVVGEKGGIIFVEHVGGGFEGRISRGQIRDVRVKITPFQRLYSLFAPVPIGNVIVIYTGPKEELEIKEEEEKEKKLEEKRKKRKKSEDDGKVKTSFLRPIKKYRKGGYNHIEFQNIPYPNLLAGIIRGVMLRSLGWRLKHAERIAMWRVARGGGAAVMIGR